MFILIPTLASSDCMATACAALVESRSVEVIAVNEKPLDLPANFKYFFACFRFCVGQIEDTGFEAYGPSGTGPTTLPLPKTASWRICLRFVAHAIARRASLFDKTPFLSCNCSARYERSRTPCSLYVEGIELTTVGCESRPI